MKSQGTKILIAMVCLSYLINGGSSFKCPFSDYLGDCSCYQNYEILRCIEGIVPPTLKDPSHFKEYIIERFNASQIDEQFFKNIKADKILITKNLELASIHQSLFNTEASTIIINENNKLNCSNLIEEGQSNSKSLSILEMRNCNIQVIKSKTFQNFTSLTQIMLQDNKITEIEEKAFYDLHNLKLLRLDNNNINNLKNESLSLTTKKIEINLKKNQINSDSLKTSLIAPANAELVIHLENNKFKEFPENPFREICHNNKSILYFGGHEIICYRDNLNWTFDNPQLREQVIDLRCSNDPAKRNLFSIPHNELPLRPSTTITTISSTPPGTTKATAAPQETTKATAAPPGTTKATAAPPGTTKATAAPPGTTKATAAPPGTTKATAAPPGTTKATAAPPGTTKATAAPPGTTKATAVPQETTKATVANSTKV